MSRQRGHGRDLHGNTVQFDASRVKIRTFRVIPETSVVFGSGAGMAGPSGLISKSRFTC